MQIAVIQCPNANLARPVTIRDIMEGPSVSEIGQTSPPNVIPYSVKGRICPYTVSLTLNLNVNRWISIFHESSQFCWDCGFLFYWESYLDYMRTSWDCICRQHGLHVVPCAIAPRGPKEQGTPSCAQPGWDKLSIHKVKLLCRFDKTGFPWIEWHVINA